jgi:hypothetical protein
MKDERKMKDGKRKEARRIKKGRKLTEGGRWRKGGREDGTKAGPYLDERHHRDDFVHILCGVRLA